MTNASSNSTSSKLKTVPMQRGAKNGKDAVMDATATVFANPNEIEPVIGKVISQARLEQLRDQEIKLSTLRREVKNAEERRDGLREAIKIGIEAGKDFEKGKLYAVVEHENGRPKPSFVEEWIARQYGVEKLDEVKRMEGYRGEGKDTVKVLSR